MRVSGDIAEGVRVEMVELPRPGGGLVMALSPLRLGFGRRLKQRGIEAPEPPTRVARDAQGKPLRDGQGQAVVLADRADAGYRAEMELYQQRVAVLTVVEALRAEPAVVFETVLPEHERWVDAADALYEEFANAGWTDGDLAYLCERACRLSNLLGDVQEARGRFFEGGATN